VQQRIRSPAAGSLYCAKRDQANDPPPQFSDFRKHCFTSKKKTGLIESGRSKGGKIRAVYDPIESDQPL
jgi:hypothetical protein